MSVATPPVSLSHLPLDPEPSWEVAKLFPNQGHWTEAEYLALDTNRLVELDGGNIRVLDMATTDHQDTAGFLYRKLFAFVEANQLGKVNYAPLPVKLWAGTMREPDVLFMQEANRERVHKQFWDSADLVMEIISEDRAHDLKTKRSEYARGGVAEYWMVDPKMQEITVLRLIAAEYEPAGIYHRGDLAKSALLDGFEVDVAAAFDAT